jgi:hypothetical protein
VVLGLSMWVPAQHHDGDVVVGVLPDKEFAHDAGTHGVSRLAVVAAHRRARPLSTEHDNALKYDFPMFSKPMAAAEFTKELGG